MPHWIKIAADLGSARKFRQIGLGRRCCMWDISMIAIGIAFFAIAISYVKGCDRLSHKTQHGGAAK
jgi:hypothetical protein